MNRTKKSRVPLFGRIGIGIVSNATATSQQYKRSKEKAKLVEEAKDSQKKILVKQEKEKRNNKASEIGKIIEIAIKENGLNSDKLYKEIEKGCSFEKVRLLLDFGVDPNGKVDNGEKGIETPVHAATRFFSTNPKDFRGILRINELILGGADTTQKNQQKETPFDILINSKKKESRIDIQRENDMILKFIVEFRKNDEISILSVKAIKDSFRRYEILKIEYNEMLKINQIDKIFEKIIQSNYHDMDYFNNLPFNSGNYIPNRNKKRKKKLKKAEKKWQNLQLLRNHFNYQIRIDNKCDYKKFVDLITVIKTMMENRHLFTSSHPRRFLLSGIRGDNRKLIEKAIKKGVIPNVFHIISAMILSPSSLPLLLPPFFLYLNNHTNNSANNNNNNIIIINNNNNNNNNNNVNNNVIESGKGEEEYEPKYLYLAAILKDNIDILALLLAESKTQINDLVYDNLRLISLAIQKRSWNIIRYLIDHDHVILTHFDAIQLINSITPQDLDLDLIIKAINKISPHSMDNIDQLNETTSQNLLHHASISDNPDIVKYLIVDKKASVDEIDQFGNTSLVLAVEKGNFEVAKVLVDFRANLFARSASLLNYSLLHLATSLSDHSLSLSFLSFLFNLPNSQNNNNNEEEEDWMEMRAEDGSTVLHTAVRSNNLLAVEFLLQQNGLRMKARDSYGLTPIDWAHHLQYRNIFNLLFRTCPVDTFQNPPSNIGSDTQKISQSQITKFRFLIEESEKKLGNSLAIYCFKVIEDMVKLALLISGYTNVLKLTGLGSALKVIADQKLLTNELLSELQAAVPIRNMISHSYGVIITKEKAVVLKHLMISLFEHLSGDLTFSRSIPRGNPNHNLNNNNNNNINNNRKHNHNHIQNNNAHHSNRNQNNQARGRGRGTVRGRGNYRGSNRGSAASPSP